MTTRGVLVIGQTWWTVALAAVSVCTGLACLAMAAARVGDRWAQLAHAAMALGMAGMLSPWGDPVPTGAGVALFTAVGVGFAGAAASSPGVPGDARHLTIASASMVVMYLLGPHGGVGPAAGTVGGGVLALLVLALSVTLAGYFVWHAWTCVDRARSRHAACRTSRVPHAVMSGLMAIMFLGVV